MTYAAERTTVGFEFLRNLAGFSGNTELFPLKPNTAFKKGQIVVMPATSDTADSGLLAPATEATVKADTIIVGVMAQNIAQADNPAAKITYGHVYTNPENVYKVSFDGHYDGTATGAGTTTTLLTGRTTSTANILRGTLVYIYEGPGEGETRIVKANDTNGVLTFEEPLAAATSTATKFIMLAKNDTGFKTAGICKGSRGLILKDGEDGKKVDGQEAPAATGFIDVLEVNMENLTFDVKLQSGNGYS